MAPHRDRHRPRPALAPMAVGGTWPADQAGPARPAAPQAHGSSTGQHTALLVHSDGCDLSGRGAGAQSVSLDLAAATIGRRQGRETDHLWSNRLIVQGINAIDDDKWDSEAKIEAVEETISLQGRNFMGAVFIGAHLRKANFRNANLRGAQFDRADLRGANFDCANVVSRKLKSARIARNCKARISPTQSSRMRRLLALGCRAHGYTARTFAARHSSSRTSKGQ